LNPKRAIRPSPNTEYAATPRLWPQLVFARDDDGTSDKRPSEPVRILVVEDDFLIGTLIETALIEAGFALVAVALSAEEAIAAAAAERPALAIMDIRLAGQRDGIDAAIELFRDYGIRCIFATAYQDEAAQRRAQPAAPLAWLRKPYTMATLVETVRRGLQELGR
jgi:two-component system, response regulator PdtaR